MTVDSAAREVLIRGANEMAVKLDRPPPQGACQAHGDLSQAVGYCLRLLVGLYNDTAQSVQGASPTPLSWPDAIKAALVKSPWPVCTAAVVITLRGSLETVVSKLFGG